MPLVRLEVRNEYGLGDPELYNGAIKKEDPKALLDGVAVAGLVGILRQLGDVAEFAADIFHDLHEQVTATSLRGRKMMKRIQNIEAALPLVEKAIQGQKSHIHFSYVAGSDWHARIQNEQNHLLSSDLPRFMMDSYEECRDSPRLYLLDKFDVGGTGACLKRYSDPSYFKRVWDASQLRKNENGPREKKKIKRKGSKLRNREVLNAVYIPRHDASRTRFTSPSMDEQSFSTENVSVADMRLNPELYSRSTSFGSRTKESHVEQMLDENPPVFPDELVIKKLPSSILDCEGSGFSASSHLDEPSTDYLDDASQNHSVQEHSVPRSSSVTWDNETEIVKASISVSCEDILVDKVQNPEPLQMHSASQNMDPAKIEIDVSNQKETVGDILTVPASSSVMCHFEEMNSETDNYMDALNTMESETETETECQTKCELKALPNLNSQGKEPETINKSVDLEHPDSPEVKVPNMLSNSFHEDAAREFSNLSMSESSIHPESIQATDFIHHEKNTVVDDASESTKNMLVERKVSETFHKDPSPESHSSGPHLMTNDGVAPMTSILKHSPSDIPCMPSVQLWTNGGLFGVEPSKPPDLGVMSMSKQNVAHCLNSSSDFSSYLGMNQPLSKGNAKSETKVKESEVTSKNINFVETEDGKYANSDPSSHDRSSGDQLSRRAHNVVPSPDPSKESSFECTNYSNDIYAKHERQVSLQRPLSLIKFSKTRQDFCIGLDASSSEAIIKRNSLIDSSSFVDFINNNSLNKGSGQSIKGISSSFSDLAQRFLVNTLQRKPSLGNGNSSGHHGVISDGVRKLDESSQPNTHEEMSLGVASQASCPLDTKEKATHEPLKKSYSLSSHYSEQSSPPLEHMKISFHPMNGTEMSNLKSDFSTGSFHEKNEDFIFPSFHLHQDHVDPLADNVSESDDDTFCRSCPYSSEDLLSPRSFTNSDMWEPDEGNECIDHEICDVSHRVSSRASISGYEQENNITVGTLSGQGNADLEDKKIAFRSESFVDLPGLDSLISPRNKQKGIVASSYDPVKSEVLSKDQPPPLPPVQWRIMKTLLMSEDNADSDNDLGTPQDLSLPLPLQQGLQSQKPSCVIEQEQKELNDQEKPNHCVTDKEVSLMEELLHQSRNKNQQLAQDNLNGQDKPKMCTANIKEPDEREEILHQIRNKSFNLRRTTASNASNLQRSSTNVANVSVAAILEKATAIRQACVGSDEGGDENWSDG